MAPDDADDHARFAALVGVMTRLVRAPDAERQIAEDRRAFLAEDGLTPADLERLADASGKRLLLYRKLIRRGITGAIRLEIPRTAARLGERFDAEVTRFIDAEAPRTHYLRDVGFEFVSWAAPRWTASAEIPAYLADLARHELSAFDVTAADAEGKSLAARLGLAQTAGVAGAGAGLPLELDRAVIFDPAVRLCRYAFAVHRLDADEAARDEPTEEPTALLAYRDADHEVRYLELTPLAAAILERLLRGDTLRDGVVGGASALSHPLDGAVLSSTAALLSDLGDRGVVLGGAAPLSEPAAE